MTDQIPPPPAPPTAPTGPAIPPPPAPPTPPAQSAAPADGPRHGKKYIIGGLTAAIVLGGGFGAYAVYDKLDGGGAQPHDVLPASADTYLRLDLDPSASQKVDLFKLIRKFPGVAKEIGITSDEQDTRELILGSLLTDNCDDVDYDKDVEPWLGDRLGASGEIEGKKGIIAVQVTDEKASRDGIKKLFGCGDESYGIAYLDGYAILSDTQDHVDEAVAATKKESLGERKDFAADFDQLGNQGVASGWADLEAIAKIPDVQEALGADVKELTKAGSVAMALRADGSAIEFAVLGGLEETGSAKTTDLAALPSDTVAALSIAGVGDQVTEGFNAAALELESTLGLSLVDIEQMSGFQLPEDLATLLGDSLTLAVGAENLETIPSLSGPDAFSALDIALALSSDQTAALDLVQRLADLASGIGIPLVASPTDDGAVLATNQDAADAIANPKGKLGDEDAFKNVIPDGVDGNGGLYVNIQAIVDALLKADPPADVRDTLEQVKQITAVGVSASQNGDRSLTRLRIAFE